MSNSKMRPAVGGMFYYILALTLGAYFTFAAVQGDYGLFRRVQISAEAKNLIVERDQLMADLAQFKNLTHRMSDAYLDLDLLDQQARDVLGYVRSDEIVIR